jgi:DNA-binding SARP family transcriptional activator/tetratricopeptide (TPR) repeat protein
VGEELWFTVLGPVRAWCGGNEVRLGPRQQRAVMAALLLREGAQASLGELVEVLWGAQPPDAAAAVVRTYIARLRRELNRPGAQASDSLIRTVGGGYVLAVSSDAFDLAVFQREVAAAEEARRLRDLPRAAVHLREALALWRGEALAGIPGAHAEAERSRLEIIRLNTVAASLETQLELGAHTAVIPELSHLADRQPLDERFRELLMLALYRAGRQAQALASYRDAQVLLAEELGVDPGPALQTLYARILRADPGLLAPHAEVSGESPADIQNRGHTVEVVSAGTLDPAPGDGPGPGHEPSEAPGGAQEPLRGRAGLPPQLAVFCGRDGELEAANALLSDPDAPPGAIVVSGMAGVGKTTFAVQWAHQLAARYPDGQFYVNLRGFDPGGVPITAAEAVRTVLEFLGVEPTVVPDDPQAATALYRGLLAERRILLVLDNARLAAQVRPLLPGASGSLAIVTSRNRLVGLQAIDGAQSITLGVPTAAQARDLLARRIGEQRAAAEPEAVQEIVERCGRLPLALAIAAAHCATRPAFPLTIVTAAMSAEAGTDAARLDALRVREADDVADARNVFSWSYHALTPQAARLFRLTALHPGPDTTARALASLAGLSLRTTGELLAELTGAHLFTEDTPGRFGCHDLLRAYAGELNNVLDTPTEQADACRRVLDHYLHSAIAALHEFSPFSATFDTPAPYPDITIIDTLGDRDAALRWFRGEHTALIATAYHAQAYRHDEHSWHLAWALDTYLYRSGHYRESVLVHNWALRAAERLEQPLLQAVSHNFLGAAYVSRGRVREALHHHTAALAICQAQGYESKEANCYLNLAIVATLDDRPQDCITYNERAVDIYRRLGELVGQATALNNLGDQYGRIGEHRKAVNLCRQSLAIFVELDEPHSQANCHDTLAYSIFHLGEHDQAFEHYQRAVDGFRDLGDGINHAAALTRLGDAHAALHDDDAARAAWSNALTTLQALNYPATGDLQAKLQQLDLRDPTKAVGATAE